jgi:hypothetical protein
MSDDHPSPRSLVWTNPAAEEKQPTLVRLTTAALTLATVPAADLDNVVTALNKGGDLAGQVIPLSAITGAEGDSGEAGLTVQYRSAPSKTEPASILFADAAQREEFLVALLAALGPGWRRRDRAVSRWVASLWILVPTAVVALLTWGLHAEAARIAEGRPPVDWGKGRLKLVGAVAHWAEAQIGPTGVLIFGGLLVAVGILLWLILLASPPVRVVLEHVTESERLGDG